MLLNVTSQPLCDVLPVELLGDMAGVEVEFWTSGGVGVLHLGDPDGHCGAAGVAGVVGVVVAVGVDGGEPSPVLCECAVDLLTCPELHPAGDEATGTDARLRRLAQIGQVAAVAAATESAAAALAGEEAAAGPSADLVLRAAAAERAAGWAAAALAEVSPGSTARLAGLHAAAGLLSECVDRLVRPGSGLAESVTVAAVLGEDDELRSPAVSEVLMGVAGDGQPRTHLTWQQNVAMHAWCGAVASGLSWRQARVAVAQNDPRSAASEFSREFYDRVVAAVTAETRSGPCDVVIGSVPLVSPLLAFAEVSVPSPSTRTWDAAFVCPPAVTSLILAGGASPFAGPTAGPWHLPSPLVVVALEPGESLSDDDRAALATLLLSEPPAVASAGSSASVDEVEEAAADLFAGLSTGLVDRAGWRAGRRQVEEAAIGRGPFEATLLLRDFTPGRFRAARAAAATAAARLGFTVDPDEDVVDEHAGLVIGSLRDPAVVVRLLVLDAAGALIQFGVDPADVTVAER